MIGELRRAPREHAKFWAVDDLDGLEAIRAVFVRHRFPAHAHEQFLIGVTEGGAERFTCRGAEHVSPAGCLRLINPGEVHTGCASGGFWAYRALYPTEAAVKSAAGQLTGRMQRIPYFRASVVHDAALAAQVRRLHVALEEPTSRLERQSLFVETVASVVLRHGETRLAARTLGTEHVAVRRAREYLDARITENISLKDLAQQVGLSPYYLIRVFRRDLGLPPFAYQLQARVRLAKALLRGGRSPSEAALEAGFYDQSHLSRIFTRFVGVPPGKYAAGVAPHQLRPP